MNSYFWKLLVGNRFLGFGFMLTALQIFSGALGYLYQILIGRTLHPNEFALFSSIMALFMFLIAPLGAMSILIVRKVSALRAHNGLHMIKNLYFQLNKALFYIGMIVILIFWLLGDHIQYYLKVENRQLINIFVLIFIFSIFYVASLAFFQGMQRFFWLGIFGLISVVLKILISLGLIRMGFGVEGALLGVLCSIISVYLFGIPILFRSLPPQSPHHDLRYDFKLVKRALPVLMATTAFAAMTQLDMTLVNWYFIPQEAGLYAAASVLGKAVLYLPGGLVLALLPIVSESHAKSGDDFKTFLQAVTVTILLCGSVSCVYWLFGDLIIYFLYGDNYKGAGIILAWYGFAILPLTVVLIAEQYLLAKGKILFSWIFLAILPIELLTIHYWHSEMWMILLIMGIFGLLMAVTGCGLMLRAHKLDKI